jgi:hypothetical protein
MLSGMKRSLGVSVSAPVTLLLSCQTVLRGLAPSELLRTTRGDGLDRERESLALNIVRVIVCCNRWKILSVQSCSNTSHSISMRGEWTGEGGQKDEWHGEMGGERWKRWMRWTGSRRPSTWKSNVLPLNFLSSLCHWHLPSRKFRVLSRLRFSFEKDVYEINQPLASSASSSCSRFSSKRVIASW